MTLRKIIATASLGFGLMVGSGCSSRPSTNDAGYLDTKADVLLSDTNNHGLKKM